MIDIANFFWLNNMVFADMPLILILIYLMLGSLTYTILSLGYLAARALRRYLARKP